MLEKFSRKYFNHVVLIARLIVGLSYAVVHGYGKISGGPERWESTGEAISVLGIGFFPAFWGFIAACSEFFGGILIVLGLFFKPAAIFIILTMVVATLHHISGGDSLSRIAHPLEMIAALMLLIIVGAGKYSLDWKLFFKKEGV